MQPTLVVYVVAGTYACGGALQLTYLVVTSWCSTCSVSTYKQKRSPVFAVVYLGLFFGGKHIHPLSFTTSLCVHHLHFDSFNNLPTGI